jgi:hypothetical protein
LRGKSLFAQKEGIRSAGFTTSIAYVVESKLWMDALEGVKPVRSKRGHSLYRLYPLKGPVSGRCALRVIMKPELREI